MLPKNFVNTLFLIINMTICQVTSNPTSFTYFPHLPPEFCLLIWEFAAASDPRVIRLHYRSGQLVSVFMPTGSLEITCKESYDVYKKYRNVRGGEVLAI